MGISVGRSSSFVHMLHPNQEAEKKEKSLSERGSSPSPSESGEITKNDPEISTGKAYYYSQLSVMLFEKAVQENANFPEDLDRVHSWFVKELSDAQKLVCLHELLSLMTPAQHRFLFTSVCFDSLQSGEDESVWLDLAITESQRKTEVNSPLPAVDNVVSKLEALDLTLGDSLFSGVKVAKNKLNFDRSASPVIETVVKSPTLSETELSETSGISRFSSFMKSTDEDETMNPVNTNTPCDPSNPSNQNNTNNLSVSHALSEPSAPPGFLSPTAKEFRPSEPSCYSEVYFVDFTQWLRLLRLHKYTNSLLPLYTADPIGFLKSDETALEGAGVAAMGARKKFLRLFERIQQEGGICKE